jgi:hypothetical protein
MRNSVVTLFKVVAYEMVVDINVFRTVADAVFLDKILSRIVVSEQLWW